MQYRLVISFQWEGYHRWPGAPPGSPLGFVHRHLFKGRAWAVVAGPNREIEFIDLKHKVEIYAKLAELAEWSTASCEQMAENILRHFPELLAVEVTEDGENGASAEWTVEEWNKRFCGRVKQKRAEEKQRKKETRK